MHNMLEVHAVKIVKFLLFLFAEIELVPIDSAASNDDTRIVSTTLTIRNLDEAVKQRLRVRAAYNKRSMEAEAREILATCLADGQGTLADKETAMTERMKRIESVVGTWKGHLNGKTTDEIMQELRGDD